jgi:tripartite ATP-independent transporter DctP family solute receptor
MSYFNLTRRHLLGTAGAAATLSMPFVATLARAATPQWTARQFHNQPAASPLNDALVKLWETVAKETKGRLVVTVHPQNNGIAGSDPAALEMLRKGELEFYTLLAGIRSNAVPAMDIQGMPFAFKRSEQIHGAMDGELGVHLRAECKTKGIYLFPHGLLENGFRDLNTVERRVRVADDMAGLRVRVPDGQIFRDLFTTLGAQPVTLNINKLYDGLKNGEVDAQENPLVICETNKLYEVTKFISTTHHSWSGFNLLGNDAFWNSLPDDIRKIVARNVMIEVAAQRRVTMALNKALVAKLTGRGLTFDTPNIATFKAKLAGAFYPRWKQQVGAKAWGLLEKQVGRIG